MVEYRQPAPASQPKQSKQFFFGREHELWWLSMLLKDAQTRFINVVGVGGAGKSRLVIELAQRLRQDDDFQRPVFFVALHLY